MCAQSYACFSVCRRWALFTQAVENEVGLIVAEVCFEETAFVFEITGETLALKDAVQVHAEREKSGAV